MFKYYQNKNDKTNYLLKYVPFNKNLYDSLNKIHAETSHRNALCLRKELLKRNYYYKEVVEDTIGIVNQSLKCFLKNNIHKKK